MPLTLLMRLFEMDDDKLVSRAQAKSLDIRILGHTEVALDFSGVEEIGQAFADELFRVYARAHPEIRITPVNTVPAVDMMIQRALIAPVEGTN